MGNELIERMEARAMLIEGWEPPTDLMVAVPMADLRALLSIARGDGEPRSTLKCTGYHQAIPGKWVQFVCCGQEFDDRAAVGGDRG